MQNTVLQPTSQLSKRTLSDVQKPKKKFHDLDLYLKCHAIFLDQHLYAKKRNNFKSMKKYICKGVICKHELNLAM